MMYMKKTLATTIVAILGWQGQTAVAASMEDRLANTEKRLQEMEQQLKGENQGGVKLSGLVEVEVSNNDPYEGDSTSDITAATVELGLAAQINPWVSAEVVLLYEDNGDTPLDVDVATITAASPHGVSFTGGQFYVPFGSFETNQISDPLTLEIGETRESAIQFGYQAGAFSGAVYMFNGTNKENSGAADKVDNFGVVLGLSGEGYSFGVGYINDIGDSDSLQDALSTNNVLSHVGGQTVNAMFEFGSFSVIGEYLAASDKFQASELDFKGQGAEPKAWNVELAYGFELGGKGATFAVAYQGTEEALALELPETRTLATLSVDLLENTSLAFEIAKDEDYSVADGGTGKSANTVTAQLAVEF